MKKRNNAIYKIGEFLPKSCMSLHWSAQHYSKCDHILTVLLLMFFVETILHIDTETILITPNTMMTADMSICPYCQVANSFL